MVVVSSQGAKAREEEALIGLVDPFKNEFLPPTATHVEDVDAGKLNVLPLGP